MMMRAMTANIPGTLTLSQVIKAMKGCEQARGINVLQHGIRVRRAYLMLRGVIEGNTPLPDGWRIPAWAHNAHLLQGLMPENLVTLYQVYHDCGKPFVAVTGGDGRRHYPGHAAASEAVWDRLGGVPQVGRLMAMDMDAHLLKADGVHAFAARPEAPTLLLTALAEVHANAEMFGGLESDSFKIKSKHLLKRGQQVIKAMAPKDVLAGPPTANHNSKH